MHGEQRGRTAKCSIDKINHRVVYNYSKIVPLRISIDRNNNLSDCPIEFEVLQEFPMVPGGRDEKMTLGVVRLNLSEYVEESENFPRRSIGISRVSASLDHAREKIGQGLSHRRQSSSKSAGGPSVFVGGSPTSGNTAPPLPHPEENDVVDEEAEEGIVRRYLMQDSKINSTLKVGILMVQIDGERNYVAPPLKTAPMFGGIAGIMTGGEQVKVEPATDDKSGAPNNTTTNNNNNNNNNLNMKSRDASELQDMYRRSLAASWACQPGELPADECIEDIFSGGDGWSDSTRPAAHHHRRRHDNDNDNDNNKATPARHGSRRSHAGSVESSNSPSNSNSGSTSGDEAGGGGGGGGGSEATTIRHPSHRRRPRAGSTKSHVGKVADDGGGGGLRSRSESLGSLAPTLGSGDLGRGREGFRRPKEVDEYEEREDLVAWHLPGAGT